MNAERKQEIRAALDAITGGKSKARWFWDGNFLNAEFSGGARWYTTISRYEPGGRDVEPEEIKEAQANVYFVAAAPDYVRELFTALDNAEAEIARLRAALEQINGLHVYQLGEAYTIADRALKQEGEK